MYHLKKRQIILLDFNVTIRYQMAEKSSKDFVFKHHHPIVILSEQTGHQQGTKMYLACKMSNHLRKINLYIMGRKPHWYLPLDLSVDRMERFVNSNQSRPWCLLAEKKKIPLEITKILLNILGNATMTNILCMAKHLQQMLIPDKDSWLMMHKQMSLREE